MYEIPDLNREKGIIRYNIITMIVNRPERKSKGQSTRCYFPRCATPQSLFAINLLIKERREITLNGLPILPTVGTHKL